MIPAAAQVAATVDWDVGVDLDEAADAANRLLLVPVPEVGPALVLVSGLVRVPVLGVVLAPVSGLVLDPGEEAVLAVEVSGQAVVLVQEVAAWAAEAWALVVVASALVASDRRRLHLHLRLLGSPCSHLA
jgi:hypothetical protein